MEGFASECLFSFILFVIVGYVAYKTQPFKEAALSLGVASMSIALAAMAAYIILTTSLIDFHRILVSLCYFFGATLGYWLGARKRIHN